MAQSDVEKLPIISSPNNQITCQLKYLNNNLIAEFTLACVYNEKINMNLGLRTTEGYIGTSNDIFVENKSKNYSGVITSNISEKSSIIDQYTETTLRFKTSDNKLTYDVVMRLYDEGVAVRYNVFSNLSFSINSDQTSIDLTAYRPDCYKESKTESGYDIKGPSANGTSIAPLFISSTRLSVLMNEAANLAIANPLQIEFRNSKFTFSQSYSSGTSIGTSWRYCIFAENPSKMIDGKYIITSLNNQNIDNTDWIKPGKTFRACIPNNKFYTDSIKYRIDFAQKMNFSYVLLDAGWYGLGYSKEHSAKSDPCKPVDELDIEEVCRYGAEKGIGIIVYVNKVAWNNYDNKKMLDLYQKWGIKGLKLGYMDGQTRSGLSQIYSIIKSAYDRQMIVNVHDEIRQTGLERQFPNLMTTEGIKGNEHRENQGNHTTLLPFSRFMTGSGDYTICYRGYPANNVAYDKMTTSKGHQLALATAFFCPIQHIFWYGKPYEYPNETEIEYFKELPTVWDDYKILEGNPSNYFSIARRSGNRWFVASHTYSARDVQLNLSFLSGEKSYKAEIYTDIEPNNIQKNTIEKKNIEKLSSEGTLSFSLAANGGAVVIISESDDDTESDLITNTEDEPTPIIDPIPNPYQDNETEENISEVEEDNNNFVSTIDNLSINKNKIDELKLYPNPAEDFITIENAENMILIFDINGKKVLEFKVVENKTEIDISGFKSGFYIVTDGKKTVKFIKQ
ncbi:MAG: glycoside hydrolase family 97 catalytic domain-containing protein [Bacteroidales bacterium]|nr:glycoside hydrolase family 97 catalytic domain-containing protein [Bacteroidales bacterium]